MKITMYELIGMLKDGKAPKKIKFKNDEWTISIFGNDYYDIFKNLLFTNEFKNGFDIAAFLNDEVEILEEEKKIPEKLKKYHFHKKQRQLANKINEIIDYLKSKGE